MATATKIETSPAPRFHVVVSRPDRYIIMDRKDHSITATTRMRVDADRIAGWLNEDAGIPEPELTGVTLTLDLVEAEAIKSLLGCVLGSFAPTVGAYVVLSDVLPGPCKHDVVSVSHMGERTPAVAIHLEERTP